MKQKIISHFAGNFLAFFEKYLTKVKKTGADEYQASCCFHEDGTPSFSFNDQTGQWFCHGGCGGGDIFTFWAKKHNLDVKANFKEVLGGIAQDFGISTPAKQETYKKAKPFEHYQLGSPIEKYPYTSAKGKVLYYNCRFSPKTFRQCDPMGLSWSVKQIKPKVPYQLPKVIEAKTVFILNGEKACNKMNDIGQVGTCNVAGEGNWTSDLNPYFKGKEVILIPDNDSQGRKHVAAVCSELKGVAASIKLLDLPGLPEKGDFVDWLDCYDDTSEAAERLAVMVEQEQGFELSEEPQKSDLISEVLAIINLDPLTREKERNRISKEHNVRKSVIDDFIKELTRRKNIGGDSEIVTEVEPAKNSVDGDAVLTKIKTILQKHLILPGGVAEPIAAWIVLTYCYDAFRILPMLGIVSPVKRCGKTTLLEVLQGLTNKGLTASNISPAAVFRTIEKYSPTLLVDEADTFLKDNDELRGVLNSGHTRAGAFVVRVEGDGHEPVKFSTWGPKAVAMIGTLPDTLQDRSVVVSLRRKAPDEMVSRIAIDFENACNELRRACKRWADDHTERLKTIKPDIPATNNDRATDNWTPLLAIAEVAGGDWPELMRKSMLGTFNGKDDSIGPKLLQDIQDIFQSHLGERIFSDDLVEALKDKKESPWVDWNRGKGLTQNGLARLLKPFTIHSKTMRIGDTQRKGYSAECFKDAFKRYIPLRPSVSSVPAYQCNNINGLDEKQSVPEKISGTDEKQRNQLNSNDWYAGTDETGTDEEKTDVPLWKRLRFESEEDYLKMIG